jgi:SHS family sialic acid transporter-like MFS transporter
MASTSTHARRAIAIGLVLSLASLPLFLLASSSWMTWIGALAIGLTGAGIIGVMPSYVGGHFTTDARATGWGSIYNLGAASGALAPLLIGRAQDHGWALHSAMAVSIGIASTIALALLAISGSRTRNPEPRNPEPPASDAF